MAIFQIDVQKLLVTEYWTNRYLVDAADISQAVSWVDDIVDAERDFHCEAVNFDRARVSDGVPGVDLYVIVPLAGTGDLELVGTSAPLFNTLRVDLPVFGGRPSRKYYRTGLGSNQIDGQDWAGGLVAVAQTAMNGLLASSVILVDPDGQEILSAVVFNRIQMRQLRRGSKRRLTPVI